MNRYHQNFLKINFQGCDTHNVRNMVDLFSVYVKVTNVMRIAVQFFKFFLFVNLVLPHCQGISAYI